jgi:uncharacterized protein with ATP-grasp and redox domains
VNEACKRCNIRAVHNIASFIDLPDEQEAAAVAAATDAISSYDDVDRYEDNPESMGEIWKAITPILGTDDPYVDTKRHYNEVTLSLYDEARSLVSGADDPAQMALRIAAIGNLIDFGPGVVFDEAKVADLVRSAPSLSFELDDTPALVEAVRAADSLVYLADNCGEVAFDKLLLEEFHREVPALDITYVVRALPILNDVTMVDADQAGMGEVARVITNGDTSRTAGTPLSHVSAACHDAIFDADVVIAKGQGNLETLCHIDRADVFFMLMAKCDRIARLCDVPQASLVCVRNDHEVLV